MKQEIFGPILPIIEYSDKNKMIEFINERAKPLALYIFSEDKKFQDTILNKPLQEGFVLMTQSYI